MRLETRDSRDVETSATDALSLTAAATVLLAGVLAAVVPAWRAGKVSPVESLRSD